jgi:Transposase, Mutator family
VRILLAICRPKGGEDVPFRSVAGLLAKVLTGSARDAFDLYVLRPPRFEQLAKVLRQAREDGTPFHAVHFDGHGIYADPAALADSTTRILGGLRLDATGTKPTPGRRGLLPSDGAPGIIRAIEECFPRALRQRCLAHKMRNLATGSENRRSQKLP